MADPIVPPMSPSDESEPTHPAKSGAVPGPRREPRPEPRTGTRTDTPTGTPTGTGDEPTDATRDAGTGVVGDTDALPSAGAPASTTAVDTTTHAVAGPTGAGTSADTSAPTTAASTSAGTSAPPTGDTTAAGAPADTTASAATAADTSAGTSAPPTGDTTTAPDTPTGITAASTSADSTARTTVETPGDGEGGNAMPYGLPGKPIAMNPFMFGLTAALGVLTAWGLAQALVSARSVIMLVLVAMFLAVGLNPIVESLQRRRVPRRVSISIVFAAVIAFFVLFGLAIVPPVTEEISRFVQAVPGYVNDLLGNETIKRLDADYQLLARLRDYVTSGDLGATIAGGIVGAGAVVLDGIFSGFTLLVLTLYFLGSLATIKEYLLALVPASRRPRTRAMTDEILTGIGGYVAGNVLISAIAGVLAWVFLEIAGAEYALALALIVAVTDLIPLVGATIGAVVVSGVVLLQSVPLGIASAIFFTLYQQVENYIIYPKVMKRSVDVAPAVTVIAALFGGTLMGIVGALIAIPVAAAVALIIREVVLPRQAVL